MHRCKYINAQMYIYKCTHAFIKMHNPVIIYVNSYRYLFTESENHISFSLSRTIFLKIEFYLKKLNLIKTFLNCNFFK